MILAHIPDADLMAEFYRRSQTGTLYLDAHQPESPYRGMWQALVAWERDRHEAGLPIQPAELRSVLHRIADERPDAVAAIAVNTTLPGREGEIDHRRAA